MSLSDPPEEAVQAAVRAGRAYTGDSDHELARVMLRAALPHLGLEHAQNNTNGHFDRAWEQVTPRGRRFRTFGFGVAERNAAILPRPEN